MRIERLANNMNTNNEISTSAVASDWEQWSRELDVIRILMFYIYIILR